MNIHGYVYESTYTYTVTLQLVSKKLSLDFDDERNGQARIDSLIVTYMYK